MKRISKILITAMALTIAATGVAMATPSTQIWIPSTDVQGFKSLHLGIDNYIRTSNAHSVEAADGTGFRPNVYVLGLTGGILPFEKLQAEIGVDYTVNGINAADSNPLSFNVKVATPEASLFTFSPALAVGAYGMGTKKDLTNANIVYGLAAKTLPVVGRLSAGYYVGNDDVLGDDDDGVLLSWDRTLAEISDKLWVAVDYQGGDNSFGAFSFGASWAFSKNVSVIFGYDIYNEKSLGGDNTFTTQLDINFP
ncbi:MAG: hypothetical protein A2075_19365 [Geobacteraceae bacterium GWC2_58_44]|nr:MAG: hypothetical protein A2075_19365 [Geobacteraceae bacterium GWC2_58_44]HBG06809.1 hypothetical protein [Geobacter sp.]